MPNVRIVNATKKFGAIIAVNDVNLSVRNGEYFSLLGPSGCGKTTLLRLIAGLLKLDNGEIFIGNKMVNEQHF